MATITRIPSVMCRFRRGSLLTSATIAVLVVGLLLKSMAQNPPGVEADILIKNGHIVDGADGHRPIAYAG
jgi:hypothetical protein